jgi:hypothetical protein
MFRLLRLCEVKDMNLRSLTVTFDEEDPLTLQLLMLEVECRRASRLPLHCSLEEVHLKESFCSQKFAIPSLLDRTRFVHPTLFLRRPPMIVENLYIRGTEPLNQGQETNLFADEVNKWLSETKFKPQIVTFSGRFKERRIRYDASLISEGENWRPINTALPMDIVEHIHGFS